MGQGLSGRVVVRLLWWQLCVVRRSWGRGVTLLQRGEALPRARECRGVGLTCPRTSPRAAPPTSQRPTPSLSGPHI